MKVLAVRSRLGLAPSPRPDDQSALSKAVAVAEALGAKYVMLHSYWKVVRPGGTDRFFLVCDHLRRLLLTITSPSVTLCVRNVAGTTCETSLDLLKLVEAVGFTRLKAVFDPASAALVGELGYGDGFPLLAPHVAYVLGRDFDPGTGIFVPPGEGICPWPRLVAHLKQGEPKVPIVIDPSTTTAGEDEKNVDPQRAKVALAALGGLLARA